MTDSTDSNKKMETVAELKVRQYFDHYLTATFPKQVQAMIDAHNSDREAHGGVERRFNRLFWMGIGMALATGSGVGYALYPLLAAGTG